LVAAAARLGVRFVAREQSALTLQTLRRLDSVRA
jgi:hypothetical protein